MSDRFAFGKNWKEFLELVDDSRIHEAERSLDGLVGRERVAGARFLDVGSGSGLFSLAATRLGAARVHSFDYDGNSVGCTQEMKRRFAPQASIWTIEQGSALDDAYLRALGEWDVVYSWGVLHHTGDMWRAIDLVARAVAPDGRFTLAIYNDQGPWSRMWTAVKRLYNRGWLPRLLVLGAFVPYWVMRGLLVDLVRRRNPLRRYAEYRRSRGMSAWTDWKDWLGGYPFEVAKPEEIFEFLKARGFVLERFTTCGGGLGCNEFTFRRAGRP